MTWQEILMSMAVAAGFYGGWKAMSVLVQRQLRLLRYVLPSVMLAWSWLALAGTAHPSSVSWMGKGWDIFMVLFFTANLPGSVVGNAVLVLLIGQPGWVQGLVGSAVVWLLWYGIVRVWEWWKRRNAPMGTFIK